VRYFGILKLALFRPTRSDQYNAGPLEVSFTNIIIISKGILRINNVNNDMKISKKRFIKNHSVKRKREIQVENFIISDETIPLFSSNLHQPLWVDASQVDPWPC